MLRIALQVSKAYYDKHPEETQSKFKLCDKAVAVALGKGDMALAEKYDKDPECKAAKKSYIENRMKIQKEKYAAVRNFGVFGLGKPMK